MQCCIEVAAMYRNSRQPWILDSTPWIPDCRCWIPVFDGGTWILDSNRWLDSGFLELYTRFQSPGFQIPKAKFSQLLDSTSKNFPEPGFPYMGQIVVFRLYHRLIIKITIMIYLILFHYHARTLKEEKNRAEKIGVLWIWSLNFCQKK